MYGRVINRLINGCEKMSADLALSILNGLDLDAAFEWALHNPRIRAERAHFPDILRLIIKAGVDVMSHRPVGDPRLLWASKLGLTEIVKELIVSGEPINVISRDESALSEASWMGHVEVVDLLLTAGADPNLRSSNNITPLYRAVQGNHTLVVALLLKYNADVNIRTEWMDTALSEAAMKGNPTIMELLLDVSARADIDTALVLCSRFGHTKSVILLLKAKANPNGKDDHGDTPLSEASRRGHVEVVQLLLDAGANVNKVDEYGNTALSLAYHGSHVDVMRLLRNAGAKS